MFISDYPLNSKVLRPNVSRSPLRSGQRVMRRLLTSVPLVELRSSIDQSEPVKVSWAWRRGVDAVDHQSLILHVASGLLGKLLKGERGTGGTEDAGHVVLEDVQEVHERSLSV